MADALEIYHGAEKPFPVSIYDDDLIPDDLTGVTITVQLFWRGKMRRTLTVGDGVEILDLSPSPPGSGEDVPAPQFQWRLTEERSAELPIGQIAHADYVLVNAANETTIYGPVPIRVLSP